MRSVFFCAEKDRLQEEFNIWYFLVLIDAI